MRKLIPIIALLALAACGGSGSPASQPQEPPSDPYATYLELNPDPSLILSREDAQTRALLGCGQQWAPGTIDAVLAEAYSDLCP